MLSDQPRLRARLRSAESPSPRRGGGRHIAGSGAPPANDTLRAIAEAIERSRERRRERAARLPKPEYPPDLPVAARKEEILRAIEKHQVVVLCGETGSGKTTQLPKMCLELGRGVAGTIGHTQPRRIAARAVAARIAEELGTALGAVVGYKVRFGDRTGPSTMVKVMTDGVLLAETQHDRFMNQYDTLIIDEAHERSLNIDFLLGYVKQLLPKRPDLKVIITSATIDPKRFSEHFGGPEVAPVIEVSGRTYPVEVRWRPVAAEDDDASDADMRSAILGAVDEVASLGRGDILVFLSGEREIREAAEALRAHHPPHTEILPLFARLSTEEQQRVFKPHGGRRIVLATNVAETSLTVPGIRCVVDTGLARVSRYSPRQKVQRLPIEAISQASADQRKGRCGRLGPGVCVRLYAESDFAARPRFTDPEILRTNLASVILQMKALRLGRVEDFPFIDAPDRRMVQDGYETLQELGAVDEKGDLTALGARLARLPIDPRLGRMILAAEKEHCLSEMLVIAAALSVQDPRERPIEKQNAADAAHEEHRDEASDFIGWLNLWRTDQEEMRRLSNSQHRKWRQSKYLSVVRMREWVDVHRQLKALVTEMGMRLNEAPAESSSVHRAVLTGLLSNIGLLGERREYSGARGVKFFIFPGSGLFRKSPQWIVAAEIVKTTRMYARTAAKIEPQWIEDLAPHLVKRSWSEPHWRRDGQRIAAYETVTLFGLPVVVRRRGHYGPVDPKVSREMFIHHALVEGEVRTEGAFFAHNREMEQRVRALEDKARKHNILADVEARFAFYEARVPRDVYTGAAFERWRKEAEKKHPRLLFMREQDLMQPGVETPAPAHYPDEVALPGGAVPLEYRFDPGAEEDGVTAVLPLPAVETAPEAPFQWLTPGMLREKATELIRTLPGEYRRSFVPAPDFAAKALDGLSFGEGSLLDALSNRLAALTGVRVPLEAWNINALPTHLRMNFRVTDDRGRPVAAGRDLPELRARLHGEVARMLETFRDSPWVRDGVQRWDFGDVPGSVQVKRSGFALTAFPAIVDPRDHSEAATPGSAPAPAPAPGSGAALRLFATEDEARLASRRGLLRLALAQMAREIAFQIENAPGIDRLLLLFAPLGAAKQLKAELAERIAERAFLGDGPTPDIRTARQFEAMLDAGWNRLTDVGRAVIDLARAILEARQAAAAAVERITAPTFSASAADMRLHLARLSSPGFLAAAPWEWLTQHPRYFKALDMRAGKIMMSGSAARDAAAMSEILPWEERWRERLSRLTAERRRDEHAESFRWLLEEMRVSLFAQELRTAVPISGKRLEKAWNELGRRCSEPGAPAPAPR